MATILRLLLPPLLLLAFLAACDPRSEEEASLAPAKDLSPAEIIQSILEAEKSITSIQEERTDISTQLAVPFGEPDTVPEESRELRIQAGEDMYLKDQFIARELCEGEPDCSDSVFPFDENLFYKGKTYYRDGSSDRWVLEPESGCPVDPSVACFSARLPLEHWEGTDRAGGFIGTGGDCPALASIEWPERIPAYSFDFSWLTNPERIESGSDDAGLIRLHGTIDEPVWSLGLTAEIEAIYAECGMDPAQTFESTEFPEPFKDYFPERFTGTADIWVDPVTFFVHRIDWSLDSLNGDRLLHTNTTAARYSLFNEAELPGPLPE